MDKSVLLQGGLVLAASLLNGSRMIPYLRKLKVGQSIREEGPSSHLEKSGTPTIGGLIFILPIFLAYCLWMPRGQADLQIVMTGFLLFAGIGFLDDYLKVVKRHNLGLRAYQKLGLQFAGSAALILWLYGAGFADGTLEIHTIGGQIDLGWLKVPFLMVFMLATINSVNLTDGLDGLATSVTGIVSAFFMAYAWTQGRSGLAGLTLFFMAGLAGFLVFNWKPAKVFMGDTGSLALGAYVALVAILLKIELLLLVYGFIYFIESLSVVLQVLSYKTRRRRIFRMSPIHHHFELGGWTEIKIVTVFSAVTLLASLGAFWILA